MSNVRELYPSEQKPIFRDQLVTLADLEIFKTSLLISIKQLLTENKKSSLQWLKSYQVKKMLGVSTGTLQNLRNNGTLPYSKVGGTIYYSVEEINKLLEERNSKSRYNNVFQNNK